MRKWVRAIAVILAVGPMACVTPALAMVVTYTAAPLDVVGGNRDHFTSLPQFDPSLGTLSGAIYTLAGDLHYSVSGAAPDGEPFFEGDPYAFSIGITLNGPGLTFKNGYETANFDVVLNHAGIIPEGTITFDESILITRLPDLGLVPFLGVGVLPLTISQSEDSDICGGGFSANIVQCSVTEHLVAAVTYTYDPTGTPVPEPSALGLVGLGILAVEIVRRRMR